MKDWLSRRILLLTLTLRLYQNEIVLRFEWITTKRPLILMFLLTLFFFASVTFSHIYGFMYNQATYYCN